MSSVTLYALASVALVSLISLVGLLTLSFSKQTMARATFFLVSVACGAMLGNAVIHLLPEAFAEGGPAAITSLLVLAGFLAFFLLEKFLLWRHCESVRVCHSADHADGDRHDHVHPVGYMSMLADGFENLIDGMAIACAYMVSIPAGIATTLAVILHEIPTEVGDFAVMLHAGFSRAKALAFNLATSLCAVVGALVAIWLGGSLSSFPSVMTPFAAGCFIYLAASGLVPQLHKELRPAHSLMQIVALALGIGSMLLLSFLE